MGKVFSERTRVVETIAGARTLKVTDTGKTFLLDAAAGATVTLPALSDGLDFEFKVAAAFATTDWVLDSAEGDNVNGVILDMGATPAGVLASGEDQINFVATAESIGDTVKLIADEGNSQWLVSGFCGVNGGITATDPS